MLTGAGLPGCGRKTGRRLVSQLALAGAPDGLRQRLGDPRNDGRATGDRGRPGCGTTPPAQPFRERDWEARTAFIRGKCLASLAGPAAVRVTRRQGHGVKGHVSSGTLKCLLSQASRLLDHGTRNGYAGRIIRLRIKPSGFCYLNSTTGHSQSIRVSLISNSREGRR